MRPRGSSPGAALLAAVPFMVMVAAGCGDSNGGTKASDSPMPSAAPQAFPAVRGQTMGEMLRGVPRGPTLVPSVSVLRAGRNRFGFILIDNARKQITGAHVALYTASQDGTGMRGPFPARTASLAVEPRYQSKTASRDPDSARSIYVARVPFSGKGVRAVAAMAQLDGRLVASQPTAATVGTPGPPLAGDNAVRIHTPTAAGVDGDLSKIDTRAPHDDMHRVDFASVLGRKPVVLVFATPLLCESRTCAPIVDATLQVQERYRGRVAFIHMEIYKDNEVAKGYRPQVRAWHLPSEPWIFGIDRRGRVAATLDGPASVDEISELARRALNG